MARNYEKRYTGLNRFLEAKQKEESKHKDVKRPPLYKLTSAEDIRKWIPNIKKELEYLLQQISGARNYQDNKIEEFKQRIEVLQKEHARFIAKLRTLDPTYKDVIPWEPRGYSRKRSRDCPTIMATTVATLPDQATHTHGHIRNRQSVEYGDPVGSGDSHTTQDFIRSCDGYKDTSVCVYGHQNDNRDPLPGSKILTDPDSNISSSSRTETRLLKSEDSSESGSRTSSKTNSKRTHLLKLDYSSTSSESSEEETKTKSQKIYP